MSLVVALIAGVIAIAALIVVGNKNSVDDDIVAAKVDQFLAAPGIVGTPSDTSPAPTAGAPATGSVIPDLTPKAELPVATEVNVAVAPNVPPPVTRTNQAIVEVHFEIVEGIYAIDPATGVDYETWGYKISGAQGDFIATPGPMIRARVGDVLRFTISNPATNSHPHNVDFHAVTGQGGGAADTSVAPGETTTIEARLLYPGMFMYHCATGDVPNHIVHGMYGSPTTSFTACTAESWWIRPIPCRRSPTSGMSCSRSTTRPAPSPAWSKPTVRRSRPSTPPWWFSTAPREPSPVITHCR
jgi:hypothetical protein